MLRLLSALLLKLLLRQLALALSIALLITLSAWAEGKAPRVDRLLDLCPLFAAFLGVAWSYGAWRQERGDQALSSLGFQPGWVPFTLLLFAIPSLLITAPDQGQRVQLRQDQISFPGGPQLRWTLQGARRDDLPGLFPLPPPQIEKPKNPKASTAFRILLLALSLISLSRGSAPSAGRVGAVALLALLLSRFGEIG